MKACGSPACFSLVIIIITVLVIFILSIYVVEYRPANQDGIQYKHLSIMVTPAPFSDKQPSLRAADKHSDQHKHQTIVQTPQSNTEASKSSKQGKKAPKQQQAKKKSKPSGLSESPIVVRVDPNKKKKGNPYWTPKVYDFQSDWGVHNEYPYIKVIPNKKIVLKHDRKLVFPNLTMTTPGRAPDMVYEPSESLKQLLQHPFVIHPDRYPITLPQPNDRPEVSEEPSSSMSLDEVMVRLHQEPACQASPIFLTMATVHDELYWQLIENYVYTLLRFQYLPCALVICVNDLKCMHLCAQHHFPCFHYQPAGLGMQHQASSMQHKQNAKKPSVMEQIAILKLYVIPKALGRGVDVFMLDLDVGFLSSPQQLLQVYQATPVVDIFVQEDYMFIMNRTKAGWKSWFTEPLPNIGVFLCRGNNKTVRVFEIAYEKYIRMEDSFAKEQPGKDQNHVLEAMRIGRGTFGLKYAYLTNDTAPLLDKLVLFNSNVYELGGDIMERLLASKQSLLVHTTCYEKSTKVMGLKAAAAYWNPHYYSPTRRTLTKQLIYVNDQQLLDEVRALLYIASLTNRALVIPNILGLQRSQYSIVYKGQQMWPGFRVLYIKKPSERFADQFRGILGNEFIDKSYKRPDIPAYSPILEPGFYWRVHRDYAPIPAPHMIYFKPRQKLLDIYQRVKAADSMPRIIIHGEERLYDYLYDQHAMELDAGMAYYHAACEERLRIWANDSIGLFHTSYQAIKMKYLRMPSIRDVKNAPQGGEEGNKCKMLAEDMLAGLRTCKNIFNPPAGNRTCFQICD